MTQETIQFQIMIPVYNVERYLDECVQSVLNQTYQNFRLILVDDGSKDGSWELCQAWAEKDSRIIVRHKDNDGALHTRRIAIALAGTEGYGLFLDSDDTLRPNALETIYEKITRTGCDCVAFGMDRRLNGELVYHLRDLSDREVLITDKRELYRAVLLGEDTAFYSLGRKAVRMACLDPEADYTPFYRIAMGEDRLQSLEIYKNSASVCFIPDVLYDYRLNQTSVSHRVRYDTWRVDFTLYETEERFLRAENVFTEQDFADYRIMQIHCLAGDLVRIAGMKTSRKNRIGLYEQSRETDYCRKLMAGGDYDRRALGKMSIVYDAFCAGRYDRIFLLERGYSLLQKLRG